VECSSEVQIGPREGEAGTGTAAVSFLRSDGGHVRVGGRLASERLSFFDDQLCLGAVFSRRNATAVRRITSYTVEVRLVRHGQRRRVQPRLSHKQKGAWRLRADLSLQA
jgi:hypothetical protein